MDREAHGDLTRAAALVEAAEAVTMTMTHHHLTIHIHETTVRPRSRLLAQPPQHGRAPRGRSSSSKAGGQASGLEPLPVQLLATLREIEATARSRRLPNDPRDEDCLAVVAEAVPLGVVVEAVRGEQGRQVARRLRAFLAAGTNLLGLGARAVDEQLTSLVLVSCLMTCDGLREMTGYSKLVAGRVASLARHPQVGKKESTTKSNDKRQRGCDARQYWNGSSWEGEPTCYSK